MSAITAWQQADPMRVWMPMKPEEMKLADADAMIADDGWVAEQKMDGTRGLAVISQRGVWWPGPDGKGALRHTAATQHLPKINPVLRRLLGDTPGEIVLDGEIMTETGEFHVFDMPYARFGGVEVIRPTDDLATRRAALETPDLIRALAGTPVRIVRQASGWRAKKALLDAVAQAGSEGVVFKRLDAPYLPGKRVTTQLKAKFTKTVDVVVMGRTQSPNAITFGVYKQANSRELTQVGNCSMIGKPEVQPGDVVEVAFLYWTGSAVYQPRLMRKRYDKLPGDCRMSQFRPYSREVV